MIRARLATLLATLLLTGASLAAGAVEMGEIPLPGGIDSERLQLIDKGQRMRVYVSLLGYDDARGDVAVFPGEAGAALGSVERMNRRFMDMISATNRFQVFDDTDTGIRDASDIVITGQLTRASQVLERFVRGRKAVTTTALSIQIKNSLNGELLDQHEAIEVYGKNRGEGAWAMTETIARSPEFKDSLADDYAQAFSRTLEHAAAYFESSMRPLAKVIKADANTVTLLGGRKHGLQAGDEMVIFKVGEAKAGGDAFRRGLTPLALVRCEGVGKEGSVCKVTKREIGVDAPQAGHYAVLSDASLKYRFE